MPIKKLVKLVEIESDDGFICDRCGNDYASLEQGCMMSHHFGYHSSRDGDEFEAVVCEECLVALAGEWTTAILRTAVSYDGNATKE